MPFVNVCFLKIFHIQKWIVLWAVAANFNLISRWKQSIFGATTRQRQDCVAPERLYMKKCLRRSHLYKLGRSCFQQRSTLTSVPRECNSVFLASFCFKLFIYWHDYYKYLTPPSFFLAGRDVFGSFLKSEFSEENIEFWLACEDYRKTESDLLQKKAEKIYKAFVHSDAAKQVSIKFIIIILHVQEIRYGNNTQYN